MNENKFQKAKPAKDAGSILKQYRVQSYISALFQSEKKLPGRTVFSVDKRQCHTSFLDQTKCENP